ncbi:MAG: acyl carrier protein [Planctomycetes bacterium]|nr:acyl carrier protein [Planctomycetota bacterium]
MSTKTQPEIIDDLAGILREFEDREYSGHIGPETQFFGDLGFASIDAVILGEKLEVYYGQKIPFNKFLAQLMQSGAEDLEVGQLAAFLEAELGRHHKP